MEEIILWLMTFILVYLIYLFLVILRKRKLDKFYKSTEINYLVTKYKLDLKKINIKTFSHVLAFSNAFIIATTVSLLSLIPNIILKLIVGFVILIPLILIVYSIIGNHYKKVGK